MVGTMGIAVTSLTPVEQTALLTVYARALDNRKPRSILRDTWADAAVAAIDYDFAALGVQTSVVCQTALRAKMLDDRVSAFIASNPDAVVVDLGGGLTRGHRDRGGRRVAELGTQRADGLLGGHPADVHTGDGRAGRDFLAGDGGDGGTVADQHQQRCCTDATRDPPAGVRAAERRPRPPSGQA